VVRFGRSGGCIFVYFAIRLFHRRLHVISCIVYSCNSSCLVSLVVQAFHLAAGRSGIGAFPLAVLGGDCKACFGDIGGNGGTGGGVFARASPLRLLELWESVSERECCLGVCTFVFYVLSRLSSSSCFGLSRALLFPAHSPCRCYYLSTRCFLGFLLVD
jgi:hypothetical protein